MTEFSGFGYYGEVKPPNTGNSLTGTVSVSTTAAEVKVGASRLDGRRGLYFQNQSTVTMLWGTSSTTCHNKLGPDAASDGNGGEKWVDVGDNQEIFVKVSSGSGYTLSVTEVK